MHCQTIFLKRKLDPLSAEVSFVKAIVFARCVQQADPFATHLLFQIVRYKFGEGCYIFFLEALNDDLSHAFHDAIIDVAIILIDGELGLFQKTWVRDLLVSPIELVLQVSNLFSLLLFQIFELLGLFDQKISELLLSFCFLSSEVL